MTRPGLDPDFPLGAPCPAPDCALRAFVADHADMPLDRLTAAIRGACRRGHGSWYDPQDRPDAGRRRDPMRQTSHQVEIAYLGVAAVGVEPAEAARNWRLAARNRLGDACGLLPAGTGARA